MQYRDNDNEQNNVFPELGGTTTGSSLSAPISLNITHRRQLHNVNFNYSRTSSDSLNQYAFVENVAGDAGIVGIATDPFDWGVPALSFSSFTGLRDVAPSRRDDRRKGRMPDERRSRHVVVVEAVECARRHWPSPCQIRLRSGRCRKPGLRG